MPALLRITALVLLVVIVAWQLFIPHPAILKLAPFLLTAALVFGIVSGVIAAAVLNKLEAAPEAARA